MDGEGNCKSKAEIEDMLGWAQNTQQLTNCATFDSRKNGYYAGSAVMEYKCKACKSGYTLQKGYCEPTSGKGCSSDYRFEECADGAKCESCTSSGKTLYKLVSCPTGYEVRAGTCEKAWSDTSNDNFVNMHATLANCKKNTSAQPIAGNTSGSDFVGRMGEYQCLECEAGYKLVYTTSGTRCQKEAAKSDSESESSAKSDANSCQSNAFIGKRSNNTLQASCPEGAYCTTCTEAGKTWYNINNCLDGYKLNASTGLCEKSCVYTNTTPPTGCKTSKKCRLGEGSDMQLMYSDECDECYEGYTLKDKKCVASCAYTRSSLPSNCETADSCTKSNWLYTNTYYSDKCTKCNPNYTLQADGSCK